MENEVKVSISITRKYGVIDATFGIEFQHDLQTGTVQTAYAKGVKAIETAFSEFEGDRLLKVTQPTQSISTSTTEIIVTEITRQFHPSTGENMIKVKGGEYSQHGITVYPEIAVRYSLNTLFPQGKNSVLVEGVTAVIDLSGKHKRVIELRGLP